MQTLIDATFEGGAFPDGWTLETQEHQFTADGFRSGTHTRMNILLPGHGWGRMEVEVEVERGDGAAITCGDNTVSLSVDLGRGSHHATVYGGAALASRAVPIEDDGKTHTVGFGFSEGRLSGRVDGAEVIAADDPQPVPFSGLLQLSFWDDCLVRRIRVSGDRPLAGPLHPCPARKADDFSLEVNVDFFDDLMHAPYTRDMFDQLFAEFKSWGVQRCHWIYYGGTKHGWWRFCPHGVDRRAAETVADAGEIFHAAVRAAHAHGVEIYGMIKPFDMGFFYSLGESDPEVGARGKLPRIGGAPYWIADFPVAHRDLLMSRKPEACGPARTGVFTRIDLVKEDDRPCSLSVEDVALYVSDDNATYRLYEGPLEREEVVEHYPVWEHTSSGGRLTGASRRSRVLRLKNLQLGSKYIALATERRGGAFGNDFVNLVHVFGSEGEERLVTYGVQPRRAKVRPEGAASSSAHTNFRELGVEFDTFPGTPTAVHPGYDAIRAPHAFDSRDGFIAVARGKEPHPVAALSPSFPETRQWWLEWVRDCLEAGADGIELRVRNHHSPFAWAEFGFEPPVVRAFKERHGVDLLATDDFDRGAWRRLRGEAYTQFYREARGLTQEYGKPLGLHVSQTMCTEPEFGSAMEVHWDWRTWIDEGLADSITMKEVWPRTRFADEVLAHARRRGVPVIFCPYANNIWRTPGGEKIVAGRIHFAREHGFDGFQYYECCSVVRAKPDGRIEMERPALRDVFQREFGNTP